MNNQNALTRPGERRNDLDWLRVIATIGVFLLHCMRMFDPMDWEVKNNDLSEGVMFPILFLIQWLMPLYFVISGASISLALQCKSLGGFIKSRFSRILVPYLTVGIFLLIPPQEYVKYMSHGGPLGEGIFSLAIRYLQEIKVVGSGFPYLALPQMHLWYLLWLFVFTLALLPLLVLIRNYFDPARTPATRLKKFLKKPGAVFLICLPIALLLSVLDPSHPTGNLTHFGGWPLLSYPIFLIMGYCIIIIDGFEEAIARNWKMALVLTILSFPLFMIFVSSMLEGKGFTFGTFGFFFLSALRSFNTWTLIVALLGFSITFLRSSNRFLKYATEASLPFYMIHQTVIVLIGYHIARDPIHLFYKLVYLIIVSFLATTILYDLIVRRVDLIRLFFGMKRRIMGRSLIVLAAVMVISIFALSPAKAYSSEDSGFHGRIETGAAVFGVSDHLSTDDQEILESLESPAGRYYKVIPGLFFQTRIKTAKGIEVYFGIPYETGELPLEAGFEMPIWNNSALKLNMKIIKDYVWEDPYLVNTRREMSDYYKKSASATITRIGGSMFSITYRIERFEVANDALGNRLQDLNRDGTAHSIGVGYDLTPGSEMIMTPMIGVSMNVMDGDANSSNSINAGLTIFRHFRYWALSFQADTKYLVYNKLNPIFKKTVHEMDSNILLALTWKNLFGNEKMFSNIIAGFEYRQTNERFLNAQRLFSGVTIGYSF